MFLFVHMCCQNIVIVLTGHSEPSITVTWALAAIGTFIAHTGNSAPSVSSLGTIY